jgi:hypothetical protein
MAVIVTAFMYRDQEKKESWQIWTSGNRDIGNAGLLFFPGIGQPWRRLFVLMIARMDQIFLAETHSTSSLKNGKLQFDRQPKTALKDKPRLKPRVDRRFTHD